VLEPDERKLSSPVLRGLGASNGARLLDHVRTSTHSPITLPLCNFLELADFKHQVQRVHPERKR
jgi:hypothetical protein